MASKPTRAEIQLALAQQEALMGKLECEQLMKNLETVKLARSIPGGELGLRIIIFAPDFFPELASKAQTQWKRRA